MNWLGDLLQTYLFYGLVAFAVTVLTTPLAIAAAKRFGIMDFPDQLLKPHARPTPYLGGTAICAGWLVAVLVAVMAGKAVAPLTLPILLGGLAMSALGLADDVWDLSPKFRLAFGAAVIGTVLVVTHTGAGLTHSILGPLGLDQYPAASTVLSYVIGVILVLGACNSTNLIDGLDGLCSGVTAIISLGFFVLAVHLASYQTDQAGHAVRLTLSIAMLGAAAGFLPHNFNPAKIFMGDAGSVLLGYNCGMMILLFAEWANFRWVVAALTIFALPVFDTALAMFRRWRSGKPIFRGDRSHFYDQLVQRGFTVRQSVLISYGLTLFYSVAGLVLMLIQLRYSIPLFIALCAATALAAQWTGMTHPEKQLAKSTAPTAAK